MAVDADLGARRAPVLREARAELARYFSRSARIGAGVTYEDAAHIAGLTPAAARRLGEAHYLVSTQVRDLLDRGVPGIFSRMARSTRREDAVGLDVRGPIDWAATIPARAATGWGTPVYAYFEATASEDVPANRVLKATLEHIVSTAADIIGAADDAADQNAISTWASYASAAGVRAATYLRDHRLAAVNIPRQIAQHDLRAAGSDRNRAYAAVVAAYRWRERLLEKPSPEALLEMLQERLFEPGKDARLYEIWVLGRIARHLAGVCASDGEIETLGGSGGPVYRFRTARGETVRVYFQTAPRAMREVSVYRDVFAAYDLPVSSRVPDIVIELGTGSTARRLLVEVKASDDKQYIADGAYKLLGYCADFGVALKPLQDGGALGLLVALDGVAAVPGVPRTDHLIRIATFDSLTQELAEMLAPFAA